MAEDDKPTTPSSAPAKAEPPQDKLNTADHEVLVERLARARKVLDQIASEPLFSEPVDKLPIIGTLAAAEEEADRIQIVMRSIRKRIRRAVTVEHIDRAIDEVRAAGFVERNQPDLHNRLQDIIGPFSPRSLQRALARRPKPGAT